MSIDAWETQFNAALDLYHGGQHDDAIGEFRSLAATTSDERRQAVALCMVGCILLYEQDSPEAAESVFRACVEMVPDLTLASVGLFHSLADLGLRTEALEEMHRFTNLRPSKEYAKILEELGENADDLGESGDDQTGSRS